MREQKEKILESMKRAIDNNQYDELWRLATIDPNHFFSLLCSRYLYKKRIDKLYFYLCALERARMDRFQLLMVTRIENDMGMGLFKR